MRFGSNRYLFFFFFAFFTFTLLLSLSAKSSKVPFINETEDGTLALVLPENIAIALDLEFPGYRIPAISTFDAKMMKYYNRNLIGLHPAVTWGDFNKDKNQDYAFILITGESPWGPKVELLVMNGKKKKGRYEPFLLGEIYGYKDDFLRFRNNKLYKGDYKKGGWYINWDKKKKKYKNLKS